MSVSPQLDWRCRNTISGTKIAESTCKLHQVKPYLGKEFAMGMSLFSLVRRYFNLSALLRLQLVFVTFFALSFSINAFADCLSLVGTYSCRIEEIPGEAIMVYVERIRNDGLKITASNDMEVPVHIITFYPNGTSVDLSDGEAKDGTQDVIEASRTTRCINSNRIESQTQGEIQEEEEGRLVTTKDFFDSMSIDFSARGMTVSYLAWTISRPHERRENGDSLHGECTKN